MAQTVTLTVTDALKMALEHHHAGRYQEAEVIYRQIIQALPNHLETLQLLGTLAHQVGKYGEAIALLERAIAINPNVPLFHSNRGAAYAALGQNQEAIACYRKALAIQPDHYETCLNLGNALKRTGEGDEAITYYRRALAIKPDQLRHYNDIGETLYDQGKLEEAITCFQQALAIKPDYPDVLTSLGNTLLRQEKLDEAIASYRKALAVAPHYAPALYNLSTSLQNRGNLEEAIATYQQLLAIQPNHPKACHNLGLALQSQGRQPEAIAILQKAVALNPNYAMAHDSLGSALLAVGKMEEAIACHEQAHRLNPDQAAYLSRAMHLKRQCCNWKGAAEEDARLRALLDAGHKEAVPFIMITLPVTPEDQRNCAEDFSERHYQNKKNLSAGRHAGPDPARLKIGYLSHDWQDHPMALLLSEVLELHNHDRFEIKAYSFGPDDGKKTRRRVMAACDSFTDIRSLSHEESAQQIAADGVHILIDLMGFTYGNRLEIAALRPAPIQTTWLGYLGTLGAPFIDYLITDNFVTPPGYEPYYREKLVRMPGCFQPNDRQCSIAERTPTRQECGLPEKGFVFASFNQSFKIIPDLFDIWMELLRKVPGSVLWLMDSNRWVSGNLRREAKARGIEENRLIFASFLPQPEHLARYRLVDLALDTFPCTSGTTGSNTLWAGCPMVSYPGKTFASRVAGSLLVNAGLAELVTNSPEEYAALALELAQKPRRLTTFRNRLRKNLATLPLFDTPAFTKALETAYEAMWRRYRAGLSPDHINVAEEIAAAAAANQPVKRPAVRRSRSVKSP